MSNTDKLSQGMGGRTQPPDVGAPCVCGRYPDGKCGGWCYVRSVRNWDYEMLKARHSASREIAPPTSEEIAAYRDLFRRELDKNMNNSSSSPSTDAHHVALHAFVQARNKYVGARNG